ncbi:MAG: TIGR02117 family protein [Devosia sp.]
MLRVIRRIGLTLLALVGGTVLLAVLGTFIPYPFVATEDVGTPLTRHVLVVGNTTHTDIAIRIEPDSIAVFGELEGTGLPISHPNARWLLFGWGGRSFYLETPTYADIKPWPTFRALTIDNSVMHVDVIGEVTETDPAVMGVNISEPAYANLLRSIAASFTRNDGHVKLIDGYAYGSADKFYEAEGSFNALVGCNVWTAIMLRSAGIRTGFWNSLPISLKTSLPLFNSGRFGPSILD